MFLSYVFPSIRVLGLFLFSSINNFEHIYTQIWVFLAFLFSYN